MMIEDLRSNRGKNMIVNVNSYCNGWVLVKNWFGGK